MRWLSASFYYSFNLFEVTLGGRRAERAWMYRGRCSIQGGLSRATSGCCSGCHLVVGKREKFTSNCLICNLFIVFHVFFLKTSCHNNCEHTEQTSMWDPVVGSWPNNIRSSLRRNGSLFPPACICMNLVIREEKRNDLFKVGSRRILYHISDLQCTSRAYHLNIAVRINWVSLNPRLSLTKCRLKVRP